MDGRNAKGQFVEGHQVSKGKGRPKRSIEEKYLKWMSARVKKADWDTITDTAVARAKSGDNQARQWLSDYLMGKPSQQVQVDGDVGFRFPEIVEVRIREVGDKPPSGPE